ncbi:uncharacterized protein [Elaeis guineensis]|uniref:ubiquitinyl hydrolase 1 n=1 Tax=Elaeis guineensis var. tenera TaxID=51953 RepID=A0A6I9RRY7_ELAGV|nr:ubiquitin carboxyl-terminal hydrolase MINDY-3 isoform X3 [Elaeis guineensis]
MADREDEELQMALRMSLQSSMPEAKRSKPRESGEESVEARNRRLQRELLASAAEKRITAEKRIRAMENKSASSARPVGAREEVVGKSAAAAVGPSAAKAEVGAPQGGKVEEGERRGLDSGEELSSSDVDQLFLMVFGNGVSRDVLAQWSNQGIRFSSDPATCMGLVQHEGGPCGVLATIQAYVLKYLLFFPDELGKLEANSPLYSLVQRRFCQSPFAATDNFASITDDRKQRALVHSMVEILFLCGSGKKAVVATLGFSSHHADDGSEFDQNEESIQADRDDPSLPLVTAPFGHASQEIVNLLLCGRAVPNVFDGRMDLGGGMFLKGIPTNVEVGFLSLLESLNFCKVGRFLKCPKWPIWVVGSESHYTVLFALDPSVQEENELEEWESKIRRAFDAQDQSGGGGFISVEGFHQVLRETNIKMPPEKLENLCCIGYIVWSEFWQALLDLDKSMGGFKDSTGLMGKKIFDIYHFNGIAKSVLNGNIAAGGESPLQRPRLCKLSVSVPPRWTQEEYLADVVTASSSEPAGKETELELKQPSQHAPLVDCIRTRWPRAICSWVGDAPSIV